MLNSLHSAMQMWYNGSRRTHCCFTCPESERTGNLW